MKSHLTTPQSLEDWLSNTSKNYPLLDIKKIRRSLHCAEKISQKNPTLDAEAYLAKGIAISEHLLPLHCNAETISAALLYPFFTKEDYCRQCIYDEFDPKIYKLLQGVSRMETIDHLPIKNEVLFPANQLDKLRRMLLAIVDDVQIVLIKLAERLTTLIHLRQQPEEQQQLIAKQIMALYAPLANRLGIGHIKWQLEDWSFRYLDPVDYGKISQELKQRRQDRENYIETVRQELTTLLESSALEKYELDGRAKHIYSLYRKIKRKQLPLHKIYDSNAFRILVPTIEDCYRLLSLIHEKWKHIKNEFDDYIAKPKANGYKSIHTIVLGPNEHYIEIQIRTFTMHEEAELGVAAHWKYKESDTSKSNYEDKIALLRNVMSWQKELNEENEERHNIYNQLFEDLVYVFTPNDDILALSLGATPLDAAYHIHTDVGHRCRGAKVNHKMVPLTYKLRTGDVIEILTSKENKPSRDWLNPDHGYLKTKVAYNKVKNWFAQQFRQEKLEKGSALWEKFSKNHNLGKNQLEEIAPHFNFKNAEDALVALGTGSLSTHAIMRYLKPDVTLKKTALNIDKEYASKTSASASVPIAGTENLLTQLARCCQPIPGDPIAGYITKGRGVSIHQQKCRNLQQAKKIRPERIIEVNWGSEIPNKYPVTLDIESTDQPTIIHDISAVIANAHCPLLAIHSHVDTLQSHCYIKLTVEIKDLVSLKNILSHLQQLPNVLKVQRL